jgi:hypothetical protein
MNFVCCNCGLQYYGAQVSINVIRLGLYLEDSAIERSLERKWNCLFHKGNDNTLHFYDTNCAWVRVLQVYKATSDDMRTMLEAE